MSDKPDFEKLRRERDTLQAFKDFVHRRLDEAGIPAHPEGEHASRGCRVGERLRVFQNQRDELLAALNLAHGHMCLYLPHYKARCNVFDVVSNALAQVEADK